MYVHMVSDLGVSLDSANSGSSRARAKQQFTAHRITTQHRRACFPSSSLSFHKDPRGLSSS